MSEDIITMTDEQFKELLAKNQTPEPPEEVKSDPALVEVREAQKALNDQVEAIQEMIQNSPALKDAKYVSPDSEDKDRTDDESKSWGDFLVAVRNNNVKRLKNVYKAALAEGVGSTGGYLVPTEFNAMLEGRISDLSVLRRAGATVVNMGSRTREVPVLDIETAPSAGDTAFAGGVTASWTEEAAAISETEPVFRLVTLVAHKLAAYSLASSEVRDDAAESIDGILATAFARAIASKENYAFFRGDGVGKPLGILTGSAKISATRSGASAVAVGDIAQMMSDLLPESWGTAAWFCNPTVADQLIQLVNNPISLLDSLRTDGPPMQMLGLPIYWTGALPALNTAGDILLADPSYYLIGDRSGISVAFSEHFKFSNDQLAWRAVKRVDGQPWVDNNITLEDGATTVSPFVVLAAG